MADKSNQPVRKRSARLQAVIDLVKDEIASGKSTVEIDHQIKSFNLPRDEEAELLEETFEIQFVAEKRKVEKQKLVTAMLIGGFVFFFGLYLLFITASIRDIVFYLAFALLLGGGYYSFKNYLEWRNL